MIMKLVRRNLKNINIQEVLRGKAVCHVVYMLNRVSTKSLEESNPYEAWTDGFFRLYKIHVSGKTFNP